MLKSYNNSKYFLSTIPKKFHGFIIIDNKTVGKNRYSIMKLPLIGATESHNNPIKKDKKDKNNRENNTTNNSFII